MRFTQDIQVPMNPVCARALELIMWCHMEMMALRGLNRLHSDKFTPFWRRQIGFEKPDDKPLHLNFYPPKLVIQNMKIMQFSLKQHFHRQTRLFIIFLADHIKCDKNVRHPAFQIQIT